MNERSELEAVWNCVLDRQWRLLYLGTDKSEAEHSFSSATQATLRSALRMGDALNTASKAAAIGRR